MSEQNNATGAGVEQATGEKGGLFRLHRYSHHNDIKYRGPLSYGGLQIMGWLCIVLSVVAGMLRLGGKVCPELAPRFNVWIEVLEFVGPMSLPFLLLVNFARILNSEEGYTRQLIRNFGAMAGIFIAFWMFYEHYFAGSVAVFATNPGDTDRALNMMIQSAAPNRFIAFNIFVDLFLCTLLMFFLNYKPARVFTGKKVIIFRLFAVLPVAYEVGCMLLKAKVIRGEFELPVMFFPLLTVKPVMTFVEFMVMAAFIKTRELIYCRHGRTHEEYEAFLATNRNAFHFAIFTAVTMLLLGALDLLLVRHLIDIGSVGLDPTNPADVIAHNALIDLYLGIGLGSGVYMAFIAPIALLFCYTRHPKFKKFLLFIPVAGIVLIIMTVVQSLYQILHVAELPKTDIMELARQVKGFLSSLHGQ